VLYTKVYFGRPALESLLPRDIYFFAMCNILIPKASSTPLRLTYRVISSRAGAWKLLDRQKVGSSHPDPATATWRSFSGYPRIFSFV
jgi:hypothetical protein